MPLKIKSADQFKTLLESLFDDLIMAKTHLAIFNEIGKHAKEQIDAVNFSPSFWGCTYHAHSQMAVVRLMRVFDQHEAGFHLLRLLELVRDNLWIFSADELRNRLINNSNVDDLILEIGALDSSQLKSDIEFAGETNPKVKNLKVWRDKATFHKDPRHVLTLKPLESKHPLPFADMEALIQEGFIILNRYSFHFDGSVYGDEIFRWNDVGFVFDALKHHPDIVSMRQDGRN